MTRATRPVLDIRGLVVHRDGTLILDRLDWRVQRGEHWVILGANGSGKTSPLSALTGYLTPSAVRLPLSAVTIRSDKGPEFGARAVQEWIVERGFGTLSIALAQLSQIFAISDFFRGGVARKPA